ncbi:MAG: hypothetical protein JKY93_00755 [Gammaproteobacteria bacterium]|nr:hypothetical protein [Gammaproteobacteria bacterium]
MKKRYVLVLGFIAYVLAAFAIFSVGGCANLGDGEFNPEFSDRVNIGDGTLYGSKAAYDVFQTAAFIAVHERPVLATNVLGLIAKAQTKLVDVEAEYSVDQAVDLLKVMIAEQCSWYCSMPTVRPYIDKYLGAIDNLKAVSPDDITVTLSDLLGDLSTEIQAVQLIQVAE